MKLFNTKFLAIAVGIIAMLSLVSAAVGYALVGAAPVTLRYGEPILVQDISVDADVFPGSNITEWMYIENTGTESYDIIVQLNETGQTLPADWQGNGLVEGLTFTIDPSSAVNQSLNIYIPKNATSENLNYTNQILVSRA